MAENQDQSQKTEQPTQKKLDDAVERGDVTQSADIVAWFVLSAMTLLLAFWGSGAVRGLGVRLQGYLSGIGAEEFDQGMAGGLFWRAASDLIGFLAGPFSVVVIAAISAHVLQRGFVFTPDKIQPDFSKVSPFKGLQRLFGMPALINFAKGLVKLGSVAVASFWMLWPQREKLSGILDMPLTASMAIIRDATLQLLGVTLVIFGLIAVLDFGWQYLQRHKRLMMTLQEVRDEHRQSEGDPHIKGRLRQIRAEKARQRMMAAVPKASVIITNPTHYAVALAYESGEMAAPVCVAKGADLMALKIREIAAAHNVPVVENPPLARSLYATVDIDETIKPEHYKAVAQVIGYVMRLRAKLASTAPLR
jgi:flagellar biosynthetic protein FlhB